MKNEKHKHAFEIHAFAEGWEILGYNEIISSWYGIVMPFFDEETPYVVNDAYVEYRKAEKEGYDIELEHYEIGWEVIGMDEIQPSNVNKLNLRIKPKTTTIELKEWQVRNLRRYFGDNSETQIAHWAFKVFDDAFKEIKSNRNYEK